MGISSLPEAIHVTWVEDLVSGVGKWIRLDRQVLMTQLRVLSLAKAMG